MQSDDEARKLFEDNEALAYWCAGRRVNLANPTTGLTPDDLAAIARAALYDAARRYDGRTKFAYWAGKLIIQALDDAARKTHAQPVLVSLDAMHERGIEVAIEDIPDNYDALLCLVRGRLNPHERRAFDVLALHVEGWTYKEIGAAYGYSKQWAWKHAHQVSQRIAVFLRGLLDEFGEE